MKIRNYLDQLTWEYTQLCQRNDGSIYGIADGLQCRKGKPISSKQLKQAITDKLTGTRRKVDEQTGFVTSPGLKGYDIEKQIGEIKGYDNEVGYGEVAAVFRTSGPPPGVIKRGKIGQHEIESLGILKDTGIVPRIHGHTFSSEPEVGVTRLGGHVKEAKGYLAMDEIKGKTAEMYLLARGGRTEKEKQDLQTQYFQARKAINQKGVAHNDLHAGNFIVKDDGSIGVIDFGLSQVGYKFALIEAMGLTTGEDTPSATLYRGNYFSTQNPAFQRISENRMKVVDVLKNRYGIDWDNDENVPKKIRTTENLVNNSPLERLGEDEVKDLIDMLYEGV